MQSSPSKSQKGDSSSLAKLRFKKAAETIAIARQIVDNLTDTTEQKKSLSDVHTAPDCLKNVLDRMKQLGIKKIRGNGNSDEDDPQKRILNKKLMSPLLLSGIDIGEVNAALDSKVDDLYEQVTFEGRLLVKKEDYESVSFSRYDSIHDRFIFSTSVMIKPKKENHVRPASSVDIIQKLQRDIQKKKRKSHGSLPPLLHAAAAHLNPSEQAIPSRHGLHLKLPKNEASKYFGDHARMQFFEHYRHMAQNLHLIAPNGMSSRYVSESRIGTAMSPSAAGIGGDDDLSAMGSNLDEPSYQLSAMNSFSNALHSVDEEFFNGLQSISTQEHQTLRKALDTELLNTRSFGSYHIPLAGKEKEREKEEVKSSLGRKGARLSLSTNNSAVEASIVSSSSSVSSASVMSSTSSTTSFTSSQQQLSMFSDAISLKQGRIAKNREIASTSLVALDKLNEITPGSPRTKYIAGCLREGLRPLPNLVIRRDFSAELDLSHYSMGDEMGRVLAEALRELPCIEAINLNDNNLTDDSLQYLIEAIIAITTLRELDLSRNKIDGQSSDALAEYLSRSDCPIIKLTLQNADVDDGECDRFVQCLVSNQQLLELDLSANLLGSAEPPRSDDASQVNNYSASKKYTTNSHVNDDEERTGGIAIAEFIQSESCRLQTLKLGWNSIRSRSAVALTSALAINKTLTYLDLNNNGMGYEAGEALGDAIMENRTLRTLLVSGNNLTATACICICVGIVENLALNRVEMNDNPIGAVGVRMIMLVSVALGSRVKLEAKNCNVIATDEKCWYNPSKPCADYVLHLNRFYDRAVAFHLLHVVAAHNSYIFSTATYEERGPTSAIPLRLIQGIAKDREQFFDEEQKKNVSGLRLVVSAASNTQLAHELFFEADADHSGKLDKEELSEVLNKIGFIIEEDRLHDIMAVFDVDGAGTIDLQEFMSLLKSQQREANLRIRDLTEYPIMTLPNEINKKYMPPKKGILRCKVIDGFVQKKKFYTISSIDQKYAYNMAKGMGDVTMVTEAVKHNKIRFDEAYSIYKSVYNEIHDKAGTLIRVLPLMTHSSDARQLVSKVTNDSRIELARIKLSFGATFRPMLGNFNGYYCLDLSKDLHRICLSRLLLESETMNSRRSGLSIIGPGKVGDLSQSGNWSCFRNEVYNGIRIPINPKMFTPMPQTGIIEFDFSGSTRPNGGELKISDRRFCKALQNICMMKAEQFDYNMERLAEMKRRAHIKSQDQSLFMPMYAFSIPKAMEIGRCNDEFYENLLERQKFYRSGMKKEEIKPHFNMMRRGSSQTSLGGNSVGDDASMTGSVATEFTNDQPSLTNNNNTANAGDTDSDDDEEGDDDGDEDGMEGKQYISPQQMLELRQKRIADQRRRLAKILQLPNISRAAKAKRLVDVIDETFNQLWIYSRHLALILILFKEMLGTPARCKYFGSYLVEIVVILFSRIVDLHNFELIWEVLEAPDCSAVMCRLGILNLFNPFKPETTLELCMDRREERMVAKMIVYLSVIEPGLNLTFKQFQWKRDIDPIPGWDVTEPWMTESGMSAHGYFAFTYYSGEGKNKNGCIPDVFLRKALTALVLLNENEVYVEDEGMPDVLVNTPAIHYNNNRDVWVNYLGF